MRRLDNRIRSLACIILALILIFGSTFTHVSASNTSGNIGAEDEISDESGVESETEENESGAEENSEELPEVDPKGEIESGDDASEENNFIEHSSAVTDILAGRNVGDKITDIEVKIEDAETGEDISEGSDISFDTYLQIYFDILFETGDITTFRAGDYAEIRIPSELDFAPLEDTYYDISDDYGNVVARITITGQIMKITFMSGADNMDEIYISFNITAAFNKEELEEGGDRELVFEVDGKGVWTIKVPFEEMEMEIEKTVLENFEQDGVYYQTWLLEVNSKKKEIQNVKVTDVLPEGVIYHSHQFRDQAGTGWSSSVSSTDGEFVFSYDGTLKETVYIEVTTKVDDFSKVDYVSNNTTGNIRHYVLTNTVMLDARDKKGNELDQAEDTAQVQIASEWISKDGNVSISDQSIHWSLYVNPERATLYNVKVSDILPDGLEFADAGSMKVIKIAEDGTETQEDPRYTINEDEEGNTVLEIILGDIEDYYVITFSTKVHEDFFEEQNSERFTNIAYISWDDADGKGYRSSDYKYTITAVNKWIEKTGYWWPARQYTEWFITINPNAYTIDGIVTVSDTLEKTTVNSMPFYQVFNPDKDNSMYGNKDWIKVSVVDEDGEPTGEVLEPEEDYTIALSSDQRTLDVTFKDGVLSNRTVVLYVESEVPEEVSVATLASAYSFLHKNKAAISVGSTQIGEVTAQVNIDKAIGAKTTLSHHTSPDYRARWRLTANPNQLKGIGTVTLRDELPEFLKVAEDGEFGIKVYEAELNNRINASNYTKRTNNSSDYLTYQYSTEADPALYELEISEDRSSFTIQFSEPAISGKTYIVVFYSELMDEFFEENRTDVKFQNRNTVTTGILPGEKAVYVSNTSPLSNDPLKKTVYSSSNGVITWDIWINNSAANVDLDGVTIVDELEEGLILDIESVKLEKQVAANRYEEVEFDANACIKYDYATNIFEFTMPEGLEPGYPYILNFSTDVLKSGNYSNTVTMKGFAGGEVTTSVEYGYMSVTDYDGSATASNKQRITLEKLDENGNGLAGAVFELRTEDGTILEQAESGVDGMINFQSLLRRNTKYYLYEITAPRGYRTGNADPIEVLIKVDSSNHVIAETLKYQAVNESILAPVKLVKTDEEGNPLEGAVFSITPIYWVYDEAGNRTPAAELPYERNYISEADGSVDLGELPYGLYSIREESAPEGYVKSNALLIVEIKEPEDAGDGEYQILYWDAVKTSDGSYAYSQRDPEEYQEKLTHISNALQTYKMTIYKTDAEDGKPLSGAVFKVSTYDPESETELAKINNSEREDGNYATDIQGRIELHLPAGYYLVEEVAAPFGYKLDHNVRQVIFISEETGMSQFQLNFENEQKEADVRFKKTAEDGQTPLENVKFNLYKIETDEHGEVVNIPEEDEVLKVLQSESEGWIHLTGLNVGIYVLQEAQAPDGYKRSMDGYVIEVRLNSEGDLYETYYKIEGGRSQTDLSNWREDYLSEEMAEAMASDGFYTIINERDIVYYNFTIYKKAEHNNMPLPNAKFEIWTSSNGVDTGEQITDGADENGHYTTDFAGEINIQLPAGTYILKEVQTPVGYEASDETITVTVKEGVPNQNTTIYNKQQTLPSIKFEKTDENGEPLNGAEFNLYRFYPEVFDSNGFPEYDGSNIESDIHFNLVERITSDPYLELEQLETGWYALQEISAPEGYERTLNMLIVNVYIESDFMNSESYLAYDVYHIEGGMSGWSQYQKLSDSNVQIQNEKISVDLSNLVILKLDDNEQALADVSFHIASKSADGSYKFLYEKDSQGNDTARRITLTTNSMGIAVYSPDMVALEEGTYYLFESSVPDGYQVKASPVEFELKKGMETSVYVENETQKAEVKFYKKDRYDDSVSGAKFNLYRVTADSQEEIAASEDPRQFVDFYNSYVSDQNGLIDLGELPFGYYILQETEAAPGYERNLDELIGIEITTSGAVIYYEIDKRTFEVTPVSEETYDCVIYNEMAGYQVRILKQDQDTFVPLAEAEFEIYEYDEAAGQKGRQVLVAGVTEDGTYLTNSRGEINVILPQGTYQIFEVNIPYGYQLAEDGITFTVDGTLNELTVPVYNEHMLKNIQVSKITDSGDPLTGAVFNLYKVDVKDTDGKLEHLGSTFLRTITSDQNGILKLNDLEFGWYVLQEAIAPGGYQRSLDALLIHVEADQFTYYDIYGGLANKEYYQLREVEDDEEILMRNESDTGVRQQIEIYKMHQINEVDVTTMALAGARFSIHQIFGDGKEIKITSGADPDGLYTTDNYGRISVQLRPGTYRIQEMEAPDGYKLTEEVIYTVVIEENTNGGMDVTINDEETLPSPDAVVIRVENQADSNIKIKKINEEGEALSGAVFSLYWKSNAGNIKIADNLVTNDDGEINLSAYNLRAGTYVLIETEAPEGYRIIEGEIEFVVTPRLRIEEQVVEVVNKEITQVYVELLKTDTEGNRLAGAEFRVTSFELDSGDLGAGEPENVQVLDEVFVSAGDGTIELGDLTAGYYAIEEIKAPEGYLMSESFLVIQILEEDEREILYWDVVEQDGEYSYTKREADSPNLTHIVNEEQMYKLAVYKTDEEAHGEPLSDVEFAVWHYDENRGTTGERLVNPDTETGNYYTDSSGFIELSVKAGAYAVEEIAAPRGYRLADPSMQIVRIMKGVNQEYQLNFCNEKITDTIQFHKVDENGNGLPGARFNLYKMDETEAIPTVEDVLAVIESGSDGTLVLSHLTEGVYLLQEQTAPDGYVRSLDGYAIRLSLNDNNEFDKTYYYVEGGFAGLKEGEDWDYYESQDITDAMAANGTYQIVNEKERFFYDISIYKRDTGDRSLPLAGAVFELYEKLADGSRGEQIKAGADDNGQYITGYNGQISLQLEAGTYLLAEIQAPKGYKRLTEDVELVVTEGGGAQSFYIYNEQKQLDLSFRKVDKDEITLGIPQALFNLYGFSVITDVNGEDIFDQNTAPWMIERLESEQDGSLAVNGLTEGWYALQEADAPEGYIRSLDIIVIRVFDDGLKETLSYELFRIEGGFVNLDNYEDTTDMNFYNEKIPAEPDKGYLSIQKLDDSGNTLAGAEFTVYTNPEKEPVATLTTDSFGTAGMELDPGKYYLEESKGIDGYEQLEEWVVFEIAAGDDTYLEAEIVNKAVKITADVVVEKRSTDGQVLAGAEFQLYTLSAGMLNYYATAVSGGNGAVEFNNLSPGYYLMEETSAPDGYVKNTDTLLGVNVRADGSVEYFEVDPSDYGSIKQIEDYDGIILNKKEEYAVRVIKTNADADIVLAGAEFAVYEKTEFYTGDGSVNDNRIPLYTGTTDLSGEWSLALPLGDYVLEEIEAPAGYLRGEAVAFTVTGTGNEVVIQVENQEITADLSFTKVAESGQALPGAVFNLYQPQIILTADGPEYEGRSFLKTVTSDAGGKLELDKLALGWYALQEAEAPEGYIRSLDILVFHISQDEQGEVQVAYYDIPGGLANIDKYTERQEDDILLVNEAVEEERYVLTIQKTAAIDQTALSGAQFKISRITESGSLEPVTEGAAEDGTYTSSMFGRIEVSLLPGNYLVEEVKAPAGYVLPEDPFNEVKISDQNVTLTIENAQEPLVVFTKYASDTGDILPGAQFMLYQLAGLSGDNKKPEWDTAANPVWIADLISNEEGSLPLSDLSAGWYALEETKAPDGYLTSEDIILIRIFEKNGSLRYKLYDVKGGFGNLENYTSRNKKNLAIENVPVSNPETGTLVIHKRDESEQMLSDAVFGLYYDEECVNPVTESDPEAQLLLITDEAGRASIELEAGTYYLKEEKAPAGYVIKTTLVQVRITEGETVHEVIINEKIPGSTGGTEDEDPDDSNTNGLNPGKTDSSNTGDTSRILLLVVVAGSALLAFLYLYKRKRT